MWCVPAPGTATPPTPVPVLGEGKGHQRLSVGRHMDVILPGISTDSTERFRMVRELHLQDEISLRVLGTDTALPDHVTVLLTAPWNYSTPCPPLSETGSSLSSEAPRWTKGNGHLQMQKQKFRALCIPGEHRVGPFRKVDKSGARTRRRRFNILGVTNLLCTADRGLPGQGKARGAEAPDSWR